jgi:hypothetical protein
MNYTHLLLLFFFAFLTDCVLPFVKRGRWRIFEYPLMYILIPCLSGSLGSLSPERGVSDG